MIVNPKEGLRRDLRATPRSDRCPDFAESDGIAIARAVRASGMVESKEARSESFEDFATAVRRIQI